MTRLLRRWLAASALALASATPAAIAQPASDGEAAVREALAPFSDLIARLPPPLRDRLTLHARQWAALDADGQARLRENLMAWDELAPQRKIALRERFDAWEHMDAATRASALETAVHFRQLPESVRLRWRERFDALAPEQRQRYLFDPSTRTAMDLAADLFPFVAAEEHAATLAMLRQLNPDEVVALRRSLARLPPAQRGAYRLRLLAMDPAQRAAELVPPR